MSGKSEIREGGYQPAQDPPSRPKQFPLPPGTAFHPATGMPLAPPVVTAARADKK